LEDRHASSADTFDQHRTPSAPRQSRRETIAAAAIRCRARPRSTHRPIMSDDPIPALKSQVAGELRRAIDGWETQELMYLLRVDQPRVSNLRNGRVERFSLEQLIRFLARMHVEVRVTTAPMPSPARRVGRSAKV
jgi:predicted XRE-type DNA-binding protein